MKILIVVVVLSFVSCTTNNTDEIYLFNNIRFVLNNGEKVLDINNDIKYKYQSLVSSTESVQFPLFRYIQSSRYEIFVGLPINTTIPNLLGATVVKGDSTNEVLEYKSDSTTYIYRKYGESGLTEYIVDCNDNLISIFVLADSTNLGSALFSQKSLSSRLISQ